MLFQHEIFASLANSTRFKIITIFISFTMQLPKKNEHPKIASKINFQLKDILLIKIKFDCCYTELMTPSFFPFIFTVYSVNG